MKSFRGTWWLAMAMGALVTYAVYDYRQEEKKAAQQEEKEKIVAIDVADIVEAKVERKNEVMHLKKSEEKWQLLEPVTDDVEADAMAQYLNSITIEKGSELPKPEGGSFKWSEYSLNEPSATIELSKKDGSKIKFSVSSQVAFDGSYYIRLNDQILIGSNGWARVIEKGSNQLRDKRLWRNPGPVERLTLDVNTKDLKDKITFVRKDNVWQAEGALLPTDGQKIEHFIEELKEIRVFEYAGSDVTAPSLKKYGLDKANTRLKLEGPQGVPPLVVELGDENNGAVFSKTSAVPAVMRMSVSDAEKLRQGRMDFRDGKAPFKLNVEQVQKVRVKGKGLMQVFSKEGTDWKLEGAKPEQKVEGNNLQKLFEKMNSLEAKEFFPAQQKVGAIQHTVEFMNSHGQPLLVMDMAEEFSPKSGKSKNTSLTYVRLNSSKDILAVPSQELKELPLDTLVSTASAPAQSEKK